MAPYLCDHTGTHYGIAYCDTFHMELFFDKWQKYTTFFGLFYYRPYNLLHIYNLFFSIMIKEKVLTLNSITSYILTCFDKRFFHQSTSHLWNIQRRNNQVLPLCCATLLLSDWGLSWKNHSKSENCVFMLLVTEHFTHH